MAAIIKLLLFKKKLLLLIPLRSTLNRNGIRKKYMGTSNFSRT